MNTRLQDLGRCTPDIQNTLQADEISAVAFRIAKFISFYPLDASIKEAVSCYRMSQSRELSEGALAAHSGPWKELQELKDGKLLDQVGLM